MGSYDYTCALSGLPISAGTPVRFLLLQSSPYSSRGNFATGDLLWYLRAPPVRCKYDDYGSVESLDLADAAIARLWVDGINVDMVEKGWGDNICHDVPTRKGMDFDTLCGALGEERLDVRRELETREQRRARDKQMSKYHKTVAKGIPTIRRIERAITKAGTLIYTVDAEHVVHGPHGQKYTYTPPTEAKDYSPTYDPHVGFRCGTKVERPPPSVSGASPLDPAPPASETWTLDNSRLGNQDHCFIVDKLRRGEIRVRVGGYGAGIEDELRLTELARQLRRRYSVMLSPGEFGHAQLIIHPKPGTKTAEGHLFDFHTRAGEPKEPKKCHLAQAMVREDVWQGIVSGMTASFSNKEYKTIPGTIDMYRKLAREAWDAFRAMWEEHKKRAAEAVERYKDDPGMLAIFTEFRDYEWQHWGHHNNNPVGYFTGDNPSITGFGMDTSWGIFAKRDDLTEAEIENFIDVIAQTTLVDRVIRTIRQTWRPVGSQGPQCGEWGEHQKFHQMLVRCTKARVAERKAERLEADKRYREWEAEQAAKKKDAQGT